MNNQKTKDTHKYKQTMACATMETPSHLDEARNFSLSPPPPPGGYDPHEIANCGVTEFVPLHHCENGQYPVHCILDKNLPARRQKTIQPPKVDLSGLRNDPKGLQLPDLENTQSLANTKPALHIRPSGGLPFSGNGTAGSDPMELMKAFVKKTYDHHKTENQNVKTEKQVLKKKEKDADRPHELTEVFLKKSVPNASRIAEVQNKLGEHLNIGRAVQLGSHDRRKRQVRKSYAAMGA